VTSPGDPGRPDAPAEHPGPRLGHGPTATPTPCDGCGLPVIDGTEGCQRLFDDETVREYDDPRFAARRRMIVDVYCLQHPDRYCASAISLAAHLTGLAVAIEQPGQAARLNAAIQRWLSGRPRLDKPSLPAHRGTVTIADLRATADVADHGRVAGRWARDVWTAHAELQPVARVWVREATARSAAPAAARR
jgi:hypothetical protein